MRRERENWEEGEMRGKDEERRRRGKGGGREPRKRGKMKGEKGEETEGEEKDRRR